MKHPLFLALMAATLLQASTFELYKDGALYTFKPKDRFVGFVPKGSVAKCEDRTISLTRRSECPAFLPLCGEKKRIEHLVLQRDSDRNEMRFIEMLIESIEPEADAKEVLIFSKEASRRYTSLQAETRELEELIKEKKENFFKSAPVLKPSFLSRECEESVTLTLPAGYISFETLYEATLNPPSRVEITQSISLKNRSGIDIEAQNASFYYRPMRRAFRPISFSPWVIGDRYIPRVRKAMKSAAAEAVMDAAMPAEAISYGSINKESPRVYKIEALKLPSTGEAVDIAIAKWSLDATYEKRCYPYRDLRVYDVVQFIPKAPIESNRWKIERDGKILSKNSFGQYMDGRYTLFADLDEDLIVRREKSVLKEKESFFGGRIKKKDGYELSIVNQSKERKSLHIVERIPVAVRSDVEVELLRVSADRKIDYRLGPKGRLDIYAKIEPNSRLKVKVLFEVGFDKDKPVAF